MTSKVSRKTRLGAVCCVLLIAIALFTGCKQETPESYAPPGYGVSIGPITDTVWKDVNGNTLKFEANGKVSVPDSMKKIILNDKTLELGDFTYTLDTGSDNSVAVEIMGAVKKFPEDKTSYTYYYDEDGSSKSKTIKLGDPIPVETLTINGKKAGDSQENIGPYSMIDSDYTTTYITTVPTWEDYVGDYYDDEGRKILQIREDGTLISYNDGEQTLCYWQYNSTTNQEKEMYQGTMWLDYTREGLKEEESSHMSYQLYPHALTNWGGSIGLDARTYWK